MSEPDSPQGKLYTLSEISNKTGISMPTLQRYKKLYQDRIPAEGRGRKQRYPENALPVFDQLRNENLGRRGRPRKDPNAPRPAAAKAGSKRTAAKGRPAAAAAPAKASAARAAGGRRGASKRAAAPTPPPARRGRGPGRKTAASGGTGKLMTLTQISEDTGISYPTLVRYVRLHGDRLPHEGKGRGRRFYPQAVDAFRQLRSESGRGGRKPNAAKTAKAAAPTGKRRGRPPGSGAGARAAAAVASVAASAEGGLHKRLKAIEKSQESLEKKFRGFVKSLQSLFR